MDPSERLIEYENASAEVRAIYDDIMATRQTDWINNFWKAIRSIRSRSNAPGSLSNRFWLPAPLIRY